MTEFEIPLTEHKISSSVDRNSNAFKPMKNKNFKFCSIVQNL